MRDREVDPPGAYRGRPSTSWSGRWPWAASQVGELRVHFSRSAPPSARDRDAVAAFGDALAAALHDAATHRELRLVTARSSYEAVHDQLTGLLNRAAHARRRATRPCAGSPHDHPVALLLLDINHFKEVNDTLGHAAGDELLQADRATGWPGLARAGDLLGRLGGDEFALLLTAGPGGRATAPPPLAYALRQAREIAERLAAPTEVAGVRMSVEVVGRRGGRRRRHAPT